MPLDQVRLDDKYTKEEGRIFLNGTQAIVRLLLMQRDRDLAAGLNTAGFVSGYRGSPLGNVDKELWAAARHLKDHHITFQPGVNEDLAATAVWGSQQVNLFPGAKYDGVFSLWYGKGPGVDRSGDVFRHANMAGVAPKGGVLVLAGDDPACKSSTVPSQSEHAFADVHIPILSPANIQDILDYGQLGWAMSRYSGLWVGMKTITENMDGSASVEVAPDRVQIKYPEDFKMPADGLHIRWPDPPLEQEQRLQKYKIYAALAFARANRIDRVVIDSPDARLGIVATGKAYLDVMQALDDLGIDEKHAAQIGLRVYKVGMPWPLEREGIRHFAEGLEEILVVEEKRAVIENQLKEQLYNWREDVRPRVVGKFDEKGEWVLPSAGELTPARIARVIAARLDQFYTSKRVQDRLTFLENKEKTLNQGPRANIVRQPYFCSGCPHNTSTRVPEGSRASAGIGCHYMVTWMDRSTATFTHMGGEGANWIGQAPFTETKHIFTNIGDGTYYHSGLLAIRAAVASGVNITYKILYNDAVAMTGGQPVDGPISVDQIAHQVEGEGVKRICVVSDHPEKFAPLAFPPGTSIHHRDELDEVQRTLRQWPGCTVIIYEQTCAAEKRRRRKRGRYPDPSKRIFINEAVCEGCGDCGVQSNCVSIVPVETEFGRKRAIDQSSCNKDYTCVKGFCPSFVTVHGAEPRKKTGSGKTADFPEIPAPTLPAIGEEPTNVVITGIGGTGVVTVGALLGMAAHLEGKGVSVLDQIGLAQKNGSVVTHVRIAKSNQDIHAVRVAAGNTHTLIGCDMVTAGSFETLGKLRTNHSRAVVNDHQIMTAAFTQQPDMEYPSDKLKESITATTDQADFVDATHLASSLLGNTIATNLFMIGYAWQKGLLPLGEEAILRAIELNGVAIDFNKQAFLWGRRAAHDQKAVQAIAGPAPGTEEPVAETLDGIIERRAGHLEKYQDRAYAERYRKLVAAVKKAEADKAPGKKGLAEAVARGYHKLLAYKDEYEVARLFADPAFKQSLEAQFDGRYRLTFHLAPPLIANQDQRTGVMKKAEFGPWLMPLFRILAKLKGLRGGPLDIFGMTEERRLERKMISDYEATVADLLSGLNADNHRIAVAVAGLPLEARGFGHIKLANVKKIKVREAELLAQFRTPGSGPTAAKAAAE